MAEGGEYNNSVQGSDADFGYSCTPCAVEGNDEKALKYCPDCKEYLCAVCTRCHLKFSATKKHTLQDNEHQRSERDSIETTSNEDKLFKCLYHLERDIEMYCGDHDMVYCSFCVAKNHRRCSGILELKEAAATIPINKQDDILRQIDTLQADIQATRQKKEVNSIALDQDKNDILKSIEDTELLIIDKVKALASDVKANTCSRYDGLKNDIQHEDSVLLRAITDTDEVRKQIKALADLDAKGQFVRYMLHKHTLSKTKNMHDSVEKDEKKMKCFKNNEFIQHVSRAEWLVQIVGSNSSVPTTDQPVYKKSHREVSVKGNGDMHTCSILGICQLNNGTFLIADRSNKSLKSLNKDFSIIGEHNLDSSPISICTVGKTEVAVKLHNHTVLFVSIDDIFIEKQSFITEGSGLIGLVYYCNELWSYTGNGITVYNREGTVIKTITHNAFEGTLFKAVGKNLVPVASDREFIYVSNLDTQAACIDKDGNVWSIMGLERLKRARRACIAENGIIFLAGFISGNIMMFNKKGKCLGELLDGLDSPDSLCFDNKNHQLIVGHENRNTITVISVDICL
ncbi:uncharacterized protein LOC132725252 [Ruditapes philippinarum]|uniref:uncharacterized protein LOC132725252 n=1 Tax=Ruditapes philippinarum TaxID=129788 RepID=UPI00295B01E1|nr:uncharacterized protein LOC132725252 [Ruditapes philippinarum]